MSHSFNPVKFISHACDVLTELYYITCLISYSQEGGYSHDIPTTLHRSKADCPVPEVHFFLFSWSFFPHIITYKILYKGLIFIIDLLMQEMVTVNVDGSVLDRIAKIMSYLRLGSSGKVLKKKKKDKDVKGSWHLHHPSPFLNATRVT